jgi:hypothetical protein
MHRSQSATRTRRRRRPPKAQPKEEHIGDLIQRNGPKARVPISFRTRDEVPVAKVAAKKQKHHLIRTARAALQQAQMQQLTATPLANVDAWRRSKAAAELLPRRPMTRDDELFRFYDGGDAAAGVHSPNGHRHRRHHQALHHHHQHTPHTFDDGFVAGAAAAEIAVTRGAALFDARNIDGRDGGGDGWGVMKCLPKDETAVQRARRVRAEKAADATAVANAVAAAAANAAARRRHAHAHSHAHTHGYNPADSIDVYAEENFDVVNGTGFAGARPVAAQRQAAYDSRLRTHAFNHNGVGGGGGRPTAGLRRQGAYGANDVDDDVDSVAGVFAAAAAANANTNATAASARSRPKSRRHRRNDDDDDDADAASTSVASSSAPAERASGNPAYHHYYRRKCGCSRRCSPHCCFVLCCSLGSATVTQSICTFTHYVCR